MRYPSECRGQSLLARVREAAHLRANHHYTHRARDTGHATNPTTTLGGHGAHTRRPRSVRPIPAPRVRRSEEHTSELQSRENLVCRLLLEKKKKTKNTLQQP